MTLLPPNATTLERAIDAVAAGAIDALPVPVGDVWSPEGCPAQLLPWLAWGVSIDIWDSAWSEQVKRDAIAAAIDEQRRKGTKMAVRKALDRIDPAIGLTEWFEDPANLAPFTFRLDLPLAGETEVTYTEDLIIALLRDISAVKPLRAHLLAVHSLNASAQVGLVGAATLAISSRLDAAADVDAAADPVWATYLQTEDGEPLQDETGIFLEAA